MINTSSKSLVFLLSGESLSISVRKALNAVSGLMLKLYGFENLNLSLVSTKTYTHGTFSKFVEGLLSSKSNSFFNEEYVETAFDAYCQKAGYLTPSQFCRLFFTEKEAPPPFRINYAKAVRPPLGLFLVALHSEGAITLPFSFQWPYLRQSNTLRRREVGRLLSSELISFVRQLDSQSDELPHKAFESVGTNKKRREWFLCAGTKLLLTTGWHSPEDVNINDLLQLKIHLTGRDTDNLPSAYRALLDVLRSRFGSRISCSAEDWSSALRVNLHRQDLAAGRLFVANEREGKVRSDRELLEELTSGSVTWGHPENLLQVKRLPGLSLDLQHLTEVWLEIELLFLEKLKRENYKQVKTGLGWWNLYLFAYLPYWFERNPSTHLQFPRLPSMLMRSVFVSKLLTRNGEYPLTFVEFLEQQRISRSWENSTHYAHLGQFQRLFEFIEMHSADIEGCNGFKQPLSQYDYPPSSRPGVTVKEPIPRSIFMYYLDFQEALLCHLNVILLKVLSEEIDQSALERIESTGNVIDTFATASMVGFVPILLTAERKIPLQFIPNVLDTRRRLMTCGRQLVIPHPHGLVENLVACYAGLRHQHIQWLDRHTFDSHAAESGFELVLLLVNTDKTRKSPWTPHVNARVIELLREQRNWASLIGEAGFENKHFYGRNPRTKWKKILPLFACTANGAPHGDETYRQTWFKCLSGIQGILSLLSTKSGSNRPLVRLLPPKINSSDPDLKKKLTEYGLQFGMGECCSLNFKTDITPHSGRVSVVSHLITFLPAALIGKYITGQRERAVTYYVKLDQEFLDTSRVTQAVKLRQLAIKSAGESIISGPGKSAAHIHAEGVNSTLAKALRMNPSDALKAYGAVSTSFVEESERGVEILWRQGVEGAAYNKTEICPFGNNCPPHIVFKLGKRRRCALCPCAVRTIDHLPAILVKQRQVAEQADEIGLLLSARKREADAQYSDEELEDISCELDILCEDLSGWLLSEEVLESNRKLLISSRAESKWLVPRPDMLQKELERVEVSLSEREFILTRIGDSIEFPSLESPYIRARMDLLRRELLVAVGGLADALASPISNDPAAECAGILRGISQRTGKDLVQLAEMLDSNSHLSALVPREKWSLGLSSRPD